jgi:formylglycine-generating enzyme required for sulfatase activity
VSLQQIARELPADLRGGAFNNNPDNARCAYRNRNNPNNRNNNNGFRVVVLSTLFQVLPE